MAFKPRIFISSTFSDNKNVRECINKHFIESGAEPILYESNLTPSTKPMTYRKDILEADFVILVHQVIAKVERLSEEVFSQEEFVLEE